MYFYIIIIINSLKPLSHWLFMNCITAVTCRSFICTCCIGYICKMLKVGKANMEEYWGNFVHFFLCKVVKMDIENECVSVSSM